MDKVIKKQGRGDSSRAMATVAAVVVACTVLPELGMAADTDADAFAIINNKIQGWVTGSAGKLITFMSIVMAGVMGVAGFPVKFMIGAIGLGLMLASASTIVDMLFPVVTP
jgi:type IV secretory pathway VirB2 component (pilin)